VDAWLDRHDVAGSAGRHAARAWRLSIPAAGWLGPGEYLFAASWQGHWRRALIDATATAVVMAVAFWRMAAATRRPSRNGNPDSVWALR